MAPTPSPIIRPAPWGRKRFLAPLPILSVLLVATAVAAPTLLRTQFTFFDDGAMTLSAVVQSVVHAGGPTGMLTGFVLVTNGHPFAVTILAASATITSGTLSGGTFSADANPVVLRIPLPAPIVVPADTTVRVLFSGTFSGSILALTPSASFLVQPFVKWVEVHTSPTSLAGPFVYSSSKVCPTPFSLLSGNADYWNSECTAA